MRSEDCAVIFDLYGTLVDVQVDEDPPALWAALAAEFFPSPARVTGEQLQAAFHRLAGELSQQRADGFLLDALFAALLQAFGVQPTPEQVAAFGLAFRQHSITLLKKKTYTDDLLRVLRNAGYRIGLVSNTEALLTHYDLQALDLADRFDALILSSSAGMKKPDPRIFRLALDALGASAGSSVFIGDNFSDDILGATQAGMKAVYLTSSGQATEAGSPFECADFDLQAVLAALQKLGIEVK